MKTSDTSPEAQKYHDSLWQKLTCEERFLKGLQWTHLNRELLIAGLRARNPHFTEEELRTALRQELYAA